MNKPLCKNVQNDSNKVLLKWRFPAQSMQIEKVQYHKHLKVYFGFFPSASLKQHYEKLPKILKQCSKTVRFSFPAILFRNQKSVTHVQSFWLYLDTSERTLPEPLPPRALRSSLTPLAHLTRRTLQPWARWRLPRKTVLQLQSLWTTHEFGHMELLFKPELQLSALQRFRLLWGYVRKRCFWILRKKRMCFYL